MVYVRLVSYINNSACLHDYTIVIRQTHYNPNLQLYNNYGSRGHHRSTGNESPAESIRDVNHARCTHPTRQRRTSNRIFTLDAYAPRPIPRRIHSYELICFLNLFPRDI